jgi:hypothetical protein
MTVTTQRNLPAQFVEDLGEDLAKQVVAQSGVPTVSVGLSAISQRPGESSDDFAARQQAAREFETRQQSLAGLAPQVAGLTTREQRARTLADQGIGSFQPFLTSAQQLTGAGAGTGAGSVQEFMSPYQSQVIDESLAEFDRQAAQRRQQVRDQATVSGAFGGGREGVQLAEFDAASDRNRAAIQAGLLNQGFGQAVARRDKAFQDQLGLAGLVPQLQSGDIAMQGQLGAVDRTLAQAGLDAQREATRQATFLPQEELDRFAGQVTGIMGGYPGQTVSTNVPNPTPLQTALGVGSTLAGIYGTVKNAGTNPFAFLQNK